MEIDLPAVERQGQDNQRFLIERFDSIPSTNTYLTRCARRGAPEWQVAVAETQTAGRGRLDRKWDSPPGLGLWLSILLRPNIDSQHLNLINLLCATGISVQLELQALRDANSPLRVDLKWPNDLLIAGRKVGGILLEASFSGQQLLSVVVGIGINVLHRQEDFSDDIREKATSLYRETGTEWNRDRLLDGILEQIHSDYTAGVPGGFDEIVRRYEERVLSRGEQIELTFGKTRMRGIFRGISPEGFLRLDTGGRETLITAGEIFSLDQGDGKATA